MKKLLLILALLPYLGTAQTSLEKMLWEAVKTCDEAIKENNADATAEGEEIDKKVDYQAKNGYLSIEGSWPTCGCGCKSTAAGFKDSKGNFTILQYENWNCEDKFGGIRSNKKLEDLMPEGFGLNAFSDQKIETNGNSYFHLIADVPAKGTDTKVTLELFPLGMMAQSKNGLSYNTDYTTIKKMSIYNAMSIIEKIENQKQLDAMLNNQYSNLPKAVLDEIKDNIGENQTFDSQEDFHKTLLSLHEYYKSYSKLNYTEIILAWNKETARFSIKSKSGSPKKFSSFLDFLKNATFYSPKC